MNEGKRKVRVSIFLKLFVVIFVSGVLISFAFTQGMFLAMRPVFDPYIKRNLQQYIHYLVADFGPAPHFPRGREMAKSLGLGIRIEGPDWHWTSSDDIPPLSDFVRRRRGPHSDPSKESHHGPRHGFFPHEEPFEIVEHSFPQGQAKVLVLGRKRIMESNLGVLVFPLGFILLVFLGGFAIMRRILRPIRTLEEGVEAIASGDLDRRVSVEGSDELAKLGLSFNEMVARIQKMVQSKKQLLSDVSHELRSPLTRAKVALALLDENDTVRQISRDLGELEEMISVLLEEAHLDNQNGELVTDPVDVVPLLRAIAGEYKGIGKAVDFGVSSYGVLVALDAARFRSVIRNLIDNALKYSDEGKRVAIFLREDATSVQIEIKDEGSGIPGEDLARVFEPFYRVDRSRTRRTGGFGLGLSLCKKIITAHGGTIELKSEMGKGTSATIILPKHKGLAARIGA